MTQTVELGKLRAETKKLRLVCSQTERSLESRDQTIDGLTNKNKELEDRLSALASEYEAKLNGKEQELADVRKELAILRNEMAKERADFLRRLYGENRKRTGELKKLGKKDGERGFHRPIPDSSSITTRQVYSLTHCPNCSHEVGKTIDEVMKYSEDIVLTPAPTVIAYTITRHWCGNCKKFVKPKIPVLPRIGPNVLGYVLYARYCLRLPMNRIKQSLIDLYSFTISEGEIVALLDQAQELFGEEHKTICNLIRTATSIHADETGWRVEGQHWQLWVFLTPEGITRFVLADSRGKSVAEEALGSKEDRVITSDFYGVYETLAGENQYCWVHLLRTAKEASVSLHEDLLALYRTLKEELTKPIDQRKGQTLKDTLLSIQSQTYEGEAEELRKLKQRLNKYHNELFTCLKYDNVLPENNKAERAIRPQVIMRKVFGCCRSTKGAETHAVNSSVITTKLSQGANFFEVILPLLKLRMAESA